MLEMHLCQQSRICSFCFVPTGGEQTRTSSLHKMPDGSIASNDCRHQDIDSV